MSKILTFIFCFIVLVAAGLIVSGSNNVNGARDAFDSLTETATSICGHGEFQLSNPTICMAKLMTKSVPCYLPVSPADVYAQKCFAQVQTALNLRYRPDLNSSLYSNQDILTWLQHAANDIDTYDYKNINNHYQDVAHYFSTHGQKTFSKFFNNPFEINNIAHWKASKTVSLDSPAQFESQTAINGVFTWEFGFPITAHFTYDNPPASQYPLKAEDNLFLHIKVVRTPKTENNNGLGIEEWNEMSVEDWDRYQEWLKHQKGLDPNL